MRTRRRPLFALALVIFLTISTGCSRIKPPATVMSTPTAQPTAAMTLAPTATVMAAASPNSGGANLSTPTSSMLLQATSCMLITSNDLAHLFPPHNEILRNPPTSSPVSHPPFLKVETAGTETKCLYYDFHQPGKTTSWMLQVTYLVDVPDPSSIQAWSQAWTAAKVQSGQVVSGLGDNAFTSGANLFIKKGDIYISFESADTQVDEKTSAGVQQLLSYEKQLAEDGFSRLQ